MLVMDHAGGFSNICQGMSASFKLAGDVLIFPIAFCGIDIGG